MIATREVDPSVSKTPIALDGENLPTVCVLCSHNCGIRVDVADGKITAISADHENPITHGYICNKAVTCDKYAHHDQRVEYPMRRRSDGTFERIDWDTAISEISAKMKAIRDEHGGRSLAVCGGGGQANHLDIPFLQMWMQAIGTKRLFNAYAQEKTQHHLVDHWMFDAASTLFLHPDMMNATYLLVMGTNPRISNRGHNATETFKALGKQEGRKVVVADPRETETTRGADTHLRVRPGGDAYVLMGIAASIVQNELYDAEFVGAHTEGMNELRDILGRTNIDEMGERAGLDGATLHEVARELAEADGAAIMFDLGVEQTPFSTLVSYLIRMILTLTNNVGRDGGNVWLELIVPPTLSSHRFDEPERALASGIPAVHALGAGMFSPSLLPEEVLIDHPERIRALMVEGSNPLLSFSDSNAWRAAIDKLDILVAVDPAFSETAQLADYVLPPPCGYEKWEMATFPKGHPGVMTQVRPPVIPGPAEARPEAEIYARICETMRVVEPLPAELEETARPETPEARAAFMMQAMGMLGDVAARGINGEAQLTYWAYRGLGHHFPAPNLVAIWAIMVRNALERTEYVLATLGPEWTGKNPFELGEELMRRVLAHPEGVEIANVAAKDNLFDNIGFEDKHIRVAPAPMLGEMERLLETTLETDDDYPFILASGLRTRWTANTIQRTPEWRKGNGPHCELNLAPDDASALGRSKGDAVRIENNRGSFDLTVAVDKKLMSGHCWMPNGFGVQYGTDVNGSRVIQGANLNEITDAADRDPFTGCPHHRYVRVKLTPVGKAEAAA
ncbi:MAG: hypothetical protein E4H03_03025 [Myxococcales bacterium]|nr:MAG: hypothetical protein E4H03_03025 [Myxococcales bacterium]